jgi:type III pantothenate kinase
LNYRVLTIDVGNTSVHFGLFAGGQLTKEWRIAADSLPARRPANQQYRQTDKIVVASVVPRISKIIRQWFPAALFVDHKTAGLKIRVKKPAEVGADRLVDALAAYKLYGGPAVIVDFGTATTFDFVNEQGEYLGGAIAPGVLLARDTLHEGTARLPRVELKAPRSVIGRDTIEAMRSGLVFGYVAMVEGMIERIKGQAGKKVKVIATGGLAKLICKYTDIIDIIDDKLTLQGLRLIADIQSKKPAGRQVKRQK